MSVIGELLVEINGDNSGLKKSLNDSGNSVTSGVGKMVSAIGLASLAWKGVELAMKGIDYNKAAEQAEIAFGSFLGSASAAKDMIEDLRDLAKETPLEFAEVRDAAKQLSAFGIEAGKIVPTMRTLADVSAGLGIPVKDLAYLFGTIKTQGKAMTVDLMQFANRGIPIWEELSKVTGKSGTELRKLVEAGGVGFPQIEQAFKNMTSEGGKFFNMAVKQMDSLAGAQSNLNDSFDVWLGHITSGLTGPIKDLNKAGADILNGWVEIDKQWFIVNAQLNIMRDHFFGIKRSSQEIRDDAFVQAKTWDLMNQRGKAYLDNEAKKADAAKKAKEEAERLAKIEKDRLDTNEDLKQEYIDQYGFYVQLVTSARAKMAIEEDNAKIIADAKAKEATGQQIVNGYMLQAISNQIRANQLEEDYQEGLKAIQDAMDEVSKGFTTWGGHFSSLSASAKKFGDDALSEILSTMGSIANEAGNFMAALGKGDYISAAVSGIALIADAWSVFFKDNSEAEKKAKDEREKAEKERIEAVRKLEAEYQAKFDSDLVRLEKERNERVSYARKIGADVLQIEAYYAGQIEKVRRTTADISIESGRVNIEKKKIQDRYAPLVKEAAIQQSMIWNPQMSEADLRAFIASRPQWLADQISFLVSSTGQNAVKDIDAMMQSELGQVVYNLQLFEERAQGATQGIGQALAEGLKSGASVTDFRKTIMDMLRNMAIEAAIIASGFQEKFKEIGVMIAEALKDGFSETELAAIDLRVNALYSSATNAINPLNELFARAGNAQNITNGGSTTINIATTNDPLTIANALGNVQQSLAYSGVVA
jgi:hypothetical protein